MCRRRPPEPDDPPCHGRDPVTGGGPYGGRLHDRSPLHAGLPGVGSGRIPGGQAREPDVCRRLAGGVQQPCPTYPASPPTFTPASTAPTTPAHDLPSDVSLGLGPFDRFATHASAFFSKAWFFAACVLLVLIWAPSYFLIGEVGTWCRVGGGRRPPVPERVDKLAVANRPELVGQWHRHRGDSIDRLLPHGVDVGQVQRVTASAASPDMAPAAGGPRRRCRPGPPANPRS